MPVALPTAGGPAGPAAANFLAGEKASPSAHPSGWLLSRDSANEGVAVLEILPSEQESRLASLPQVEQALPTLAENFLAVWLSAVQMTEGQIQPAEGPQPAPPSEDPSSENPSAARGSDLAKAMSLATARKGATATVKQTVTLASPLTALVYAAAVTPAGATLPPKTAEAATHSVATAETPEGTPNSGIPTAPGLKLEGISQAAEVKGSGVPGAELTEARIVPTGQQREAPHRDNADLLPVSKAPNVGQSVSGESTANEHASARALPFANASEALQEAPAAGELQNDLPSIETLTEEGPNLREATTPTEKSLIPSASAAPPSPLLSLARESHGDSGKAIHSVASQGAAPSTAAANVARLSTMLATGGQESSAAAETAFKAEIRPNTTNEGPIPAASNPDGAKPSRQGQQRAAANPAFQNLTSASSSGEAELSSESPLAQPGNLPARTTTSYAADLAGSPRPATASGAPRQAAPTGPPPATELDAARLERARPSTKQAGEVTVQLRSEEHGTANIRFREHAGQVQVTVRAGDPQLVQSLRSGLDQLKSGLDTQGFQTTVWSGSSSAAPRRGEGEGSSDTYHRAQEDSSGQDRRSRDHSGRGNQQAEEWMDEIE
jgi:hypothetical protein